LLPKKAANGALARCAAVAINIGTAGWNIPRDVADRFPDEGSALERYAARFPVAEINSSFHREHRISTWQRWRDSVPANFRFSAKLPKTITHQAKLAGSADLVAGFIDQVEVLGDKLAVLLVQLPPKLELDVEIAMRFFADLRGRIGLTIACEPRNASWFTDEADLLLKELKVARVAADPSICEAAASPGGWRGLDYWRLHGSPVVYRSSYLDRVRSYAGKLSACSGERWCIFDNTASSAAAGDGLALMDALAAGP
jgi:uncharacterized protein YecE (DUF72 family)